MLIGGGLVGVLAASFIPPEQSTVAVQGPEVTAIVADKLAEPKPPQAIVSAPKVSQTARPSVATQTPARPESASLPAPRLQPDPSPSAPSKPPLVVAARPRTKRPPVNKPDPTAAPEPDAKQPDAQPPAAEREQPQGDNSPAGDPAKRAAFVRTANSLRLAMSQRDLAAAKRHAKLLDVNAQTPADQAQAERLQILLENLEEFWKAVRTSVSRLQPLDELELKDNRVAVVEASPNELTIMMYGRHQRYRIDALPLPLLQVIVNRSLAATASSKMVVGTFLAMDKEGDRKQARKLWEEAAKAGENQGKQLMPELDIPMPAGSGAKKR